MFTNITTNMFTHMEKKMLTRNILLRNLLHTFVLVNDRICCPHVLMVCLTPPKTTFNFSLRFGIAVIFGINAKNEKNGRHFKTEGKN
jgi:hypothetical protein